MFRFCRNYNVFESDITFLNGSVNYTGNVISKSLYSVIEEAVISLKSERCVVHMERFKKGEDAVIVHFVEDGIKKKCIEYEDARRFMIAFNEAILKEEKLLVFCYIRKVKDFCTGILQSMCLFTIFYSIYMAFLKSAGVFFVLLGLWGSVCFLTLSRMYFWHRTMKAE